MLPVGGTIFRAPALWAGANPGLAKWTVAKFLITVWPIAGHYHPCLAVAKALRERGHEVAFFTGARAAAAIEKEGFRRFPFQRTDEAFFESIFYKPQPPTPWWKPELLVRRERYTALLLGALAGQVPDLEEVVASWKPDAMVCDPTFWGPILVTQERHRIPLAVFAFVPFCPLPGSAAPPVGLGLPLPKSFLGRCRNGLVGGLLQLGTARIRGAANALRWEYGLPPLHGSVAAFAGSMPLYVVMGTREFDYPRPDLPSTVHYVGSCLYHRQRQGPLPAWLEETPGGRPWVYVTEGTVNTRAPLVLSAAAKGLADLPAQVLLETSQQGGPEQMGLPPLAPNMRLEHWTNIYYDDLLPRSRAVVTLGGAGMVVASLRAGVPMVIIPAEWDKPEVAQRAAEAGAAIRLPQRSCTPRNLRAAVERVLHEPSFRANAERLGASFERYRGPAAAAELLEAMAASQTGAEAALSAGRKKS